MEATLRSPHRRRTQQGFTLVEVLITILILCVGLLGSVGMQAAAMQANTQTRYQVSATALASELAEAMRGNHLVALQTSAAANPYLIDFDGGAITAPPEDCQQGECQGNDATARLNAAQWQVSEWVQRAADELPSARIVVCFDSAPFDSSGQSRWACDGSGDVVVAKMAWTRIDTSGALTFSAQAPRPLLVIPVTAGSPP